MCFVVFCIAQAQSTSTDQTSFVGGVVRSDLLNIRLMGATTDYITSQNANQLVLRTGAQVGIQGNRVSLSLAAAPIEPVAPSQSMTLTALIRGDSLDGAVTFTANGANIAACSNVAIERVSLVSSLANTGIARCRVVASAGAEDTFAVTYRYQGLHPRTGETEAVSTRVRLRPNLAARYHDMWWAGSAENGWGLSIAQHGETQFNALYAYDDAGKSTWYVMPGGTWNQDRSSYSGNLYQPKGAPYFQYDSSALSVGASVGNVTISFSNTNTATLRYTINGKSGVKSLQRQQFGAPEITTRMAVGDLWWGGAQQNGWGINIAQQGDTLFVVWFTYDASGKPAFIVMPGGRWTGTRYEGAIYVTESSPWLGVPYDATRLRVSPLGSMTIEFSDSSTAIMTYLVDGVSRTNIITRQPFE